MEQLPAPLPVQPIGNLIPAQADTDAQLISLWLHGRSAGTARAYAADVRGFLAQCG
jgi:hypothetical protein